MTLPLYIGPAVLAALTALCALLARRSPAWRRLAWCLAALAAIDVARMVTLPRAALRAWGWWQADVALVAVWPAVMAWGLQSAARSLRHRHARDRQRPSFDDVGEPIAEQRDLGRKARKPDALVLQQEGNETGGGSRDTVGDVEGCHPLNLTTAAHIVHAVVAWGLRLGGRHVTADGPGGSSPGGASASHRAAAHAWPIVAGLAYAVALGIARPYLPAAAYLAGLAVPRVALAGIWAGAVWRMARGGRRDEGPGCWLPHAAPVPEPSSAAPGIEPGNSPLTGSGVSSFPLLRPAHPTPSARLAQVCALVLAAGDVACALAPWSRVVVGVPPPWWVAQALTLGAYAGAACVMGWTLARARR